MAFIVAQTASFAGGGVPTATLAVTFASAQKAGNLIVAVLTLLPGNTISSISDVTGNTYTQAVKQSDTGSLSRDTYVYYAWNIGAAAASANTLTVVVGTANVLQDLIAAEWGGALNFSTPFDSTGSATGITGAPTCSLTTALPGELVVGVSASTNGQTGVGAAWTKRVQTTDNVIMLDRVIAAAGSATPNTTPTDTDWCIAAASFKPFVFTSLTSFPDLVDV